MPQRKPDTYDAGAGASHSVSRSPNWDYDDLSTMLRSYDRQPFLDLLAVWLNCAPDPADILAFAKKKPDLWVKALSDVARIAGYTEKQEVLHTVNITQMSDSQLEDAAASMAAKLGLSISPRLLSSPSPSPIPSENDFSKSFSGRTIDASAQDATVVRSKPRNSRPRK